MMKYLLAAIVCMGFLASSHPAYADQQVFAAGQLTLAPNVSVSLTGMNLVLQYDGNFVAYMNGKPVWASGSFADCTTNCVAAFQTDGNLVLYHAGAAYWSTHTYNHPAAQFIVTTQSPYVEIVNGSSELWPVAGTPAPTPSPTPVPAPVTASCPTAACFYIDSVNGADGNAGTSSNAPWKSLANLAQAAITPGTSILLKRGSQFTGQQLILKASGTASSPVSVDAYGSGALPVISGGTNGVLGQGISYISISNLAINSVSGAGILGAGNGTEYWTISNCTINNAAIAGIQAHPTYNGGAALRGWVVQGNTIGTVNTPATLNYDRGGILLQATYNALVTKNTVASVNATGIRLDSYNNTLSQFTTLSYNEVTANQGGISVRNTLNALITHNWIHDGKGFAIGIGGGVDASGNPTSYNNSLTYNLAQNMKYSDDGILYNGFDVNSSVHGQIYQNTIENVSAHSITLEGDYTPANNWIVRNNIIDARRQGTIEDGNCFLFRLVSYQSETLSNNLFMSNLNWVGVIGTDMNATTDLAIWYTPAWIALGIDTNSLYNQDPSFINVTGENLGLAANSYARNLGTSISGIGQVSLDAGALPYGQTSVLAF